jgi:putative transposase
MVREECQQAHVDILPGPSAPDQVPVLSSSPPHVTRSRLSQRMKGKSAYRLMAAFPPLRKRCWGRRVWARGYFCRRSGNVPDAEGHDVAA